MKCYTVAELDITDRAWVRDYVTNVTPLVENAGGRYLARTPKIETIEGARAPRQIFLLIEWPSRETAMTFYESDEYRPWREQRLGGSAGEMFLIAGEDVNRAVRDVSSTVSS